MVASPVRPNLLSPVAIELVSARAQLGGASGVLSQAFDESLSVDNVLLRIRQDGCRAVANAKPAGSAVDASDPAAYKPKTEFDNTPLIRRILELRREEAQLLGYNNFAEVSLVPKMARGTADGQHLTPRDVEPGPPQRLGDLHDRDVGLRDRYPHPLPEPVGQVTHPATLGTPGGTRPAVTTSLGMT